MNCLITIKEITFVVLKFPAISRPESFTGEVYQMFKKELAKKKKKELAPILHNLLQKTEKKGYFPIHFIKYQPATKNTQLKKEKQRKMQLPLKYRCKYP